MYLKRFIIRNWFAQFVEVKKPQHLQDESTQKKQHKTNKQKLTMFQFKVSQTGRIYLT